MKANLLIDGNCQGSWFYHMLQSEPIITRQYNIHYYPNYGEVAQDHPVWHQDFWNQDTLFIRQVAPHTPEPLFQNRIPADCRQLRYPTLWGKMFWPFNISDPRNHPEEALPFGRFFYGDRLIVKWLDEGLTGLQIVERYLNEDISQHINIDRYVQMSFAEMRFTDQRSDIKIASFIEANFRHYKLFGSINHPSVFLLEYVLTQMKAWIMNNEGLQFQIPAHAADILGEEEIPIHPQLIEKLKLEWAWPDMKYRYRSKMLTFAEYVKAYADFELIPAGAPESLWLEQAEQAFGREQHKEAKRLLMAGLHVHPSSPRLIQPLAALLTETGHYEEAFALLARAIAVPDLDNQTKAQLYNNLGIIQFYQGAAVPAGQSFQQALTFWPDWQEARDNLHELQAAGF